MLLQIVAPSCIPMQIKEADTTYAWQRPMLVSAPNLRRSKRTKRASCRLQPGAIETTSLIASLRRNSANAALELLGASDEIVGQFI